MNSILEEVDTHPSFLIFVFDHQFLGIEPRGNRDVSLLGTGEECPFVLLLKAFGSTHIGVVGGENTIQAPKGEPVLWAERLVGISRCTALNSTSDSTLTEPSDEAYKGISNQKEEEGHDAVLNKETQWYPSSRDGNIPEVCQHVGLERAR